MYVMIRVNQRWPAADVNLHFDDDQGWIAFEKMCSIARSMFGYIDQLMITHLDDGANYKPTCGVNISVIDKMRFDGRITEHLSVMYCDYSSVKQ